MHHRTTRLRFRTRVLIAIVLGAIITLLTAYGSIHFSSIRSSSGTREGATAMQLRHWWNDSPSDYPDQPPGLHVVYRGFGLAAHYLVLNEVETKTSWRLTIIRVGWPMRCVYGTRAEAYPINGPKRTQTHGLPVVLGRLTPIISIWSGLIINMLFFAAIIMSIAWLNRASLRAWRRLHRRCPACAYDLRGGPHQCCPECGEGIAARSSRCPESATARGPAGNEYNSRDGADARTDSRDRPR